MVKRYKLKFWVSIVFLLLCYFFITTDIFSYQLNKILCEGSDFISSERLVRNSTSQKIPDVLKNIEAEVENYLDRLVKEGEMTAEDKSYFLKIYQNLNIEIVKKFRSLTEALGHYPSFAHFNTTKAGGGVAALLGPLEKIFNQLGATFKRIVIEGEEEREFPEVVKKIFKGLQGEEVEISSEEWEVWEAVQQQAFDRQDLKGVDFGIVHDGLQKLIESLNSEGIFSFWRNHSQSDEAVESVLNHINPLVRQANYVVAIYNKYLKPIESENKKVIVPSISPASGYNRLPTKRKVEQVLREIGLKGKRFISQIARFDPFKRQHITIEAFKQIKPQVDTEGKEDLSLVLVGELASDDLGWINYWRERLKPLIGERLGKDIFVFTNVPDDISEEDEQTLRDEGIVDINVEQQNIIQWKQMAQIHPALKETYGLTVASARYKGIPVIVTDIGGPTEQIKNNENGIVIPVMRNSHPLDDLEIAKLVAQNMERLINNEELIRRLGNNAKRDALESGLFLQFTLDWMDLFIEAAQQKVGRDD